MKLFMPLLSLAISTILCLSSVRGEVVKDGLIAYWPFDRSTIDGKIARDLTGNYDGTMSGDPTIVPGKYGEAMEFDGKDDYLDLTVLKGFGPHLGTFSIDFWIKTMSTPDWTTLFKTLSDGLSMGWAVDLNRSAKPGFAHAEGVTHFYVRDRNDKDLPAEINADIYDNAWHHIAWVVEDASSNTCRVYVDGKPQEVTYGNVKAPADFEDFQHPVYLGAANNRGKIERFCPVVVDEFRIYRKALTEREVLQNLASGAAVDCSDKLAIAWGKLKIIR